MTAWFNKALVAATVVLALGESGPSSATVAQSDRPASWSASHAANQAPSAEAQRVADWVAQSADNGGLPFMIVDKINSRLFLFDAAGTLRAVTPVLLGLARGDDSPPGIGTRKLSAILPAERITPAGRFVVEPGKDLVGRDILWIDYDAAIALHRASDRTPNSGGRSRVERLASATPAEKRISLGCINVSTAFYDSFIQPTFERTKGIAYILPETRPLSAEFNFQGSTSVERTAAGLQRSRGSMLSGTS